MGNGHDNLTRIDSSEKAKEMGAKGGRRSGEVRRAKRKAMDDAQWVLNLIVSTGKKMDPEKIKKIADVNGKQLTVRQAGLLALAKRAIKGDLPALKALVELADEMPSEKKDINLQVPVLFEGIDEVDD